MTQGDEPPWALTRDWVRTFSPRLQSAAEAALEAGTIVPNFQYSVPRVWLDDQIAPPSDLMVIWYYPAGSIWGEPYWFEK